VIVPGGALHREACCEADDPDSSASLPPSARWVSCPRGFFLPVKVLSRVFRGKLLEFLRQEYQAGYLAMTGGLGRVVSYGFRRRRLDLRASRLRVDDGGRVQFCHDSTLFVATGMNGPIRIKGLRYRPDAIANTSGGGTYPSVVVDLSTCVFDYLGISNTFANNHGLDKTTVYNGPVTVLPFTGGSAPASVYVDLQFTTPFVYDPTLGGDLLIEFVANTGWIGAAPGAVDHGGPTPAALP